MDLGNLGMLGCIFDKEDFINASDYATFLASSGASQGEESYNAACDYNHDGFVNSTDYAIYLAFSGAELSNAIYG